MGTCETCLHWDGDRGHVLDQPIGRCRQAPPVAGSRIALLGTTKTVERGEWPWTAFDDWCGWQVGKPGQAPDTSSAA